VTINTSAGIMFYKHLLFYMQCSLFLFQNEFIDPNKFTFDDFFTFYRHLVQRTEVDKVFDEM